MEKDNYIICDMCYKKINKDENNQIISQGKYITDLCNDCFLIFMNKYKPSKKEVRNKNNSYSG